MAMVSKEGFDAKDRITVAMSISSLSSAIRFLGHLLEMGLEATIDDSCELITQIIIKCRATEIDKINFALYLTEQWVEDASIQSAN